MMDTPFSNPQPSLPVRSRLRPFSLLVWVISFTTVASAQNSSLRACVSPTSLHFHLLAISPCGPPSTSDSRGPALLPNLPFPFTSLFWPTPSPYFWKWKILSGIHWPQKGRNLLRMTYKPPRRSCHHTLPELSTQKFLRIPKPGYRVLSRVRVLIQAVP